MEMVCVLQAVSAQPHAPVALTVSVQLATPQYSLPSMLLGSGESPGWNTPQLLYLGRWWQERQWALVVSTGAMDRSHRVATTICCPPAYCQAQSFAASHLSGCVRCPSSCGVHPAPLRREEAAVALQPHPVRPVELGEQHAQVDVVALHVHLLRRAGVADQVAALAVAGALRRLEVRLGGVEDVGGVGDVGHVDVGAGSFRAAGRDMCSCQLLWCGVQPVCNRCICSPDLASAALGVYRLVQLPVCMHTLQV
jgi:hypothetical protein